MKKFFSLKKFIRLAIFAVIMTALCTLCLVNWHNGNTTIKSLLIIYDLRPYLFFAKFILSCFTICFVIAFLVTELARYLRKYPLTAMSLLSFIISVLKFNPFFEDKIESWIRIVWLTDYSFGIVNRGFCGEVLSLISRYVLNSDQITDVMLHTVFNCIMAVGMVVTLVWIHYIEKKSVQNEGIRALVLLWVVSPFFVTFFYTGYNLIGRLDMVLLILFFISLILICSNRCVWLVFPISICSVLVYQEFTILLFPFVFVLLLNRSMKSGEGKSFLITVCTTIGTLATTVYIYLWGHLKETVISRQDFCNWMQARTDAPIDFAGALTYTFGDTGVGKYDIPTNHLYFRFVFLIVLCIPVVLLVSIIFFRLFSKKKEWKHRFVYMLMLMSPCVILLTLSASDLMRYWTCFYTAYLNTAVAIGIMNQDEAFCEIENVDKIFSQKFGKHYLTCLCAIMLLVGVSVNSSWPFVGVSDHIVVAVDNIVSDIKTDEFPINTYVIADIQADDVISPDLTTGATIMEEYVIFEKDIRNIGITIRPVTWCHKYDDSMTLHVEIENEETQEMIGVAEISANQLPDNNPYSISFKGSDVTAGTWYCFRFYMTGTTDDQAFCLMHSDEGTADPLKHYAKLIDNYNVPTTEEQVSYDIISEIMGINK